MTRTPEPGRPASLFVGTRPAPPGPGSAALTFAWRGLLKIRHVPEQLGDIIAIPLVFTLLFTYLFGGALAGSTAAYLRFLLPGTLVMAVLLVTVYSGVGLNTDLTQAVLDRFRSLPIWQGAPLVGALVADLGRYLVAGALVLALGLVIGFRPQGGAPGALGGLALTVLFAVSLSWAWLAVGLLLRSPAAVMTVGTVVLFPLTLASNILVRPATMPGWLRDWVGVNPVAHLVTAVRGLVEGAPNLGEIAYVLAAAAALWLVMAPLSLLLYRRSGR